MSTDPLLRIAAGAYNKRTIKNKSGIERSKTFMHVSDQFHGFLDIHEHDELDMEKAVISDQKKAKAEELTEMDLVPVKDISNDYIDNLLGTYTTLSNGCCGPSYCVESFNISRSDVKFAGDVKEHLVSCCNMPAQHHLGDEVVLHMVILKKNAVFNKGFTAWLIKKVAGDVVYVFTVSKNGIVRFHIPQESGMFVKICYAWADSESTIGFFKNIRHAMTNGCFCLGVFYAPQNANAAAKSVLMRFNRWKTDVVPYWAGVCSA